MMLLKYIKNILNNKCLNHEYYIYETSNILQLDEMGYPLMLCIQKCSKCEKTKQMWIDVDKKLLENKDYKILNWKRL